MVLLLLLGCRGPAADLGVYRSGPNAIAQGELEGELMLWGPMGTVRRLPTPDGQGNSLLGEAGPLWRVSRELPAPARATPVAAALAERASFRMREVLGAEPSAQVDADRASGVALRSMVKVRRHLAPPVYVVVATRGQHGIPGPGGTRSEVENPRDCEASVALLDDDLARVIASSPVPGAARTCAVPSLLAPVDHDGDGVDDVLAYGQAEGGGFRQWFVLRDEALEPGPASLWTAIP